jgi:hypothetical protein
VIGSLIIGAVLAALALAFVLGPVLVGPTRARSPWPGGPSDRSVGRSGERPDGDVSAIDVLREIEFDRATGKLSDADYGALKSTYTTRALAELRVPVSADSATAPSRAVGPAPGVVLHPRSCPDCGTGARADALYCINCARYLAGICPVCGGPVRLPAARFCSGCGTGLGGGERGASVA